MQRNVLERKLEILGSVNLDILIFRCGSSWIVCLHVSRGVLFALLLFCYMNYGLEKSKAHGKILNTLIIKLELVN
jgi:hypothetical protein